VSPVDAVLLILGLSIALALWVMVGVMLTREARQRACVIDGTERPQRALSRRRVNRLVRRWESARDAIS
jgi:ABC-type nickel/cobalt efflux system permease component RcnA